MPRFAHPVSRTVITYSRNSAEEVRQVELPLVIGVLADLSGRIGDPLPPVGDRKFIESGVDNFDELLRACAPRLTAHVPNRLTDEGGILVVNIGFESMNDFLPDRVALKVEPLRLLLEQRTRFSGLLSRLEGKVMAEELIEDLLLKVRTLSLKSQASPASFVLTSPQTVPTATVDPIQNGAGANAELQRLIQVAAGQLSPMLKLPQDPGTAQAGQHFLEDLVAAVLKGHCVTGDVTRQINQIIARLDQYLSAQVNEIVHHPEFLRLEAAWRGLDYLVKRLPRLPTVKVKVMNISKEELGKTLQRYSGKSGPSGWDQSPIFKRVAESPFLLPQGEPFCCIVGDYTFDHSSKDTHLLRDMSRICAVAHTPFIASASPEILQLRSWQQLGNPLSCEEAMSGPEYAAWRCLRDSEDSRYLALTLPRFLSRLPYGIRTVPVQGFDFEEDCGPDPTGECNYVWANAAYAMAANIARSFADTGLCINIRGVEGGGMVEGLPVYAFPTTDGGVGVKCPTEIAISQRRECELNNLGFTPLSHWRNTDFAVFVGAQTMQRPTEYDDTLATEHAKLRARLPYVFIVSRFAHYLKKMICERGWQYYQERAQLETQLNEWIMLYTSDPGSAPDIKEKKPLADAKIEVEEIPGNPGRYVAQAYLLPHIQTAGVMVHLGVVPQQGSNSAFMIGRHN